VAGVNSRRDGRAGERYASTGPPKEVGVGSAVSAEAMFGDIVKGDKCSCNITVTGGGIGYDNATARDRGEGDKESVCKVVSVSVCGSGDAVPHEGDSLKSYLGGWLEPSPREGPVA
jgi:hypothetical protein